MAVAQGPIDAALRRTQLIAEAQGYTAPDTNFILDPNPQLLIISASDDITLIFSDGLGLSGAAAGNAYTGYQFNYDYTGGQFTLPTFYQNAHNFDVPAFDSGQGNYYPSAPGTVIQNGLTDAPTIASAASTLASPIAQQTHTLDYVSGIIAAPSNQTYTIASGVPYDFTITGGHSSSFGTGSGSVAFPTPGSYAAGSDISLTLSGVTAGAANFNFRIDYTRTIQ